MKKYLLTCLAALAAVSAQSRRRLDRDRGPAGRRAGHRVLPHGRRRPAAAPRPVHAQSGPPGRTRSRQRPPRRHVARVGWLALGSRRSRARAGRRRLRGRHAGTQRRQLQATRRIAARRAGNGAGRSLARHRRDSAGTRDSRRCWPSTRSACTACRRAGTPRSAWPAAAGRPALFRQHCEAHIAEDFPSCVGLITRLNGGVLDGFKMKVALGVIRERFDDATWYTHDDPAHTGHRGRGSVRRGFRSLPRWRRRACRWAWSPPGRTSGCRHAFTAAAVLKSLQDLRAGGRPAHRRPRRLAFTAAPSGAPGWHRRRPAGRPARVRPRRAGAASRPADRGLFEEAFAPLE